MRGGGRLVLACVLVAASVACDGDLPEAKREAVAERVQSSPPPKAPASGAVSPATAPSTTAVPEAPVARAGKAPARGCALLPARTSFVSKVVSPASVVSTADGFRVAVYEPRGVGESVALYRVSPGNSAAILGAAALKAPNRLRRGSGPAMIATAGGVALGAVDGAAHVYLATADARGAVTAWKSIGVAADLRFAPALWVAGDDVLVAWTESFQGANRVWVTPVQGEVVRPAMNVMPGGLGGATPVFLPGETGGATLTFMDPREGISPIVRVPFDKAGAPGEGEVLRPVGSAAAFPQLAVARAGALEFIGYTVIGNAATTAVGIFSLATKDEAPIALTHGTGYGVLHVAAVSGPNRAVFASETPLGVPATSPRAIELRIADAEGLGQPLTITAGKSTAFHVALARAADGTLAVTYTDPEGVHVAWATCDD